MSSEETAFHRNRSATWLRTLHDEVLRAVDIEERKQPLATVLGYEQRLDLGTGEVSERKEVFAIEQSQHLRSDRPEREPRLPLRRSVLGA